MYKPLPLCHQCRGIPPSSAHPPGFEPFWCSWPTKRPSPPPCNAARLGPFEEPQVDFSPRRLWRQGCGLCLGDASGSQRHVKQTIPELSMTPSFTIAPTLAELLASMPYGLPPRSQHMYRANCREHEPQTPAKQAVSTISGAPCLLPQPPSTVTPHHLGMPQAVRTMEPAVCVPELGCLCYVGLHGQASSLRDVKCDCIMVLSPEPAAR